MMEALAPLEWADGYWNVSLHDNTNFDGKELPGTALFAYGMAWVTGNNILKKKNTRPNERLKLYLN